MSTEYITLERCIYDAMLNELRECSEILRLSLNRLNINSSFEWVDEATAEGILLRSERAMQDMRSSGKIGYSLIDGKVYYPASEICRILNASRKNGD